MEGGPSGFRRGFTCPVLLGIPVGKKGASPKGLSPATAPLSSGLGSQPPFHLPVPQPRGAGSTVWASVRVRSPLLAESLLFSSPPATEMFHFAGYRAPCTILFMQGRHPFRMTGCPIRKSPDQRPHASPRSLSQLATSFIACRRQGIRHTPVQSGRLNRKASRLVGPNELRHREGDGSSPRAKSRGFGVRSQRSNN